MPQSYKNGMRTSGLIYASTKMIEDIREDNAPEQVANVAYLPGIVGKSLAMPDIHWGYGFSIGGVAATDADNGVISPGGVGYDINCGVRLLRTNLTIKGLEGKVRKLIDEIFVNVPSGVGSQGKIRLGTQDMNKVLEEGAQWAVKKGYGTEKDLEYLEERGMFAHADSSKVEDKAKQRGASQLGTLGAGNHFLEIQKVEEIYDANIAKAFGIREVGQIMVMIHTGSRGLGHQVCTDNLRAMENAVKKYNIQLPDKQLACAPVDSPEAKNYYAAMACAANYAWANRQLIVHWVREAFEKVLGRSAEELDMNIIYDVAHNIAKLEEHIIDGKRRKVYVHRKGATRAFVAGRQEVPKAYRDYGQPVLIPGDMGRASYVLVGTERAMKETFGSTCHGAGRKMSREEAIRRFREVDIKNKLSNMGIYVRGASRDVISEEAPEAYKDVNDVVDVTHGAGISIKVAKMIPLGVMKG
ncbi:MAG: RtcB family protein [Thermoplasmata archaeon]